MAKEFTYSTTTTAALRRSGKATDRTGINTLAVTFTKTHFTGGVAANVAGATTSNLMIDFADLAVVAAC